jgi:hypothetical protein
MPQGMGVQVPPRALPAPTRARNRNRLEASTSMSTSGGPGMAGPTTALYPVTAISCFTAGPRVVSRMKTRNQSSAKGRNVGSQMFSRERVAKFTRL